MRLRGSSVDYAGRVEICVERTWTSICDKSWDFLDSQVVCRDLGYSPYGMKTNPALTKLYRYAFVLGAISIDNCYNEGQLSFGITNINCTGSEDHLVNCSHSNAVLYNCDTYDDAGVQCQSELVIM